MVKHEKLSRPEHSCSDAVGFSDDDRCTCAECKLQFHLEMAAWAREQLMAQVEPALCVIQNDKNKCAKTKDGKRQNAESKGVKTEGKDNIKGKDKSTDEGNAYPRGFMPWNTVIKKVAAKSFMDINSVKLITDAVKLVAEEEILAGRAFHFRGLGSFKLVTGPRVEASAAQGRAFDAISVLGLAKLEQ